MGKRRTTERVFINAPFLHADIGQSCRRGVTSPRNRRTSSIPFIGDFSHESPSSSFPRGKSGNAAAAAAAAIDSAREPSYLRPWIAVLEGLVCYSVVGWNGTWSVELGPGKGQSLNLGSGLVSIQVRQVECGQHVSKVSRALREGRGKSARRLRGGQRRRRLVACFPRLHGKQNR